MKQDVPIFCIDAGCEQCRDPRPIAGCDCAIAAETIADLSRRLAEADIKIADMRSEQELFDADAGERQKILDWLADRIGLPKDRELEQTDIAFWLSTHEQRLAEAGRENERLREALQWYADETNYDTGQDCPDVLIDGGGIAKRALITTPPPGSAAG